MLTQTTSVPLRMDEAPPPSGFYPAGNVEQAWRREPPGFAGVERGTAARKAGVVYERKVQAKLKESFPEILIGPWFGFVAKGGKVRFCQADAVLVRPGSVFIFEIKVRHCALAWWQLQTLYRPVVRTCFGLPTTIAEITKSFDPAIRIPIDVELEIGWEKLECWVKKSWTSPDRLPVFQDRKSTRLNSSH